MKTLVGEQRVPGYEFSHERTHNILLVRRWGLWDLDVARKFDGEFEEHVKVMAARQPWYIIGDVTEFSPQSAEVQRFLTMAMECAKAYGMRKNARVVKNVITKIQLERLSQESNFPIHAYFTSETEARQWLLEK